MNGENDILSEGILRLCQNDSDAARLIEGRQKEFAAALEQYMAEIELFNPAYGLVGAGSREELVVSHILDSLAPLGIVSRLLAVKNPDSGGPVRIADAGSGAGLPGIPLAIAFPRFQFTLIERMGRRAGFLRNTQAVLGLANVDVEECEMEQAAPGRFDLVTFRAFRPLEPKMLKNLFKLCSENGILAAYKGRREKIDEESDIITKAGNQFKIISCQTPFLDKERHILLIWSGTCKQNEKINRL